MHLRASGAEFCVAMHNSRPKKITSQPHQITLMHPSAPSKNPTCSQNTPALAFPKGAFRFLEGNAPTATERMENLHQTIVEALAMVEEALEEDDWFEDFSPGPNAATHGPPKAGEKQ